MLPGDAAAAVEHTTLSAAMYTSHPALLVACLRGKDRPWKQALLAAWRAQRSGKVDAGDVLRDAATRMSNRNMAMWTLNVGRNVSHHSGRLAMLQQKGIVKKLRPGRSKVRGKLSASRRLVFGVGGTNQYVVQPSTALSRRAIANMTVVGQVLLDMQAPRTLRDWQQVVRLATQRVGTAERQNPYMWPWLSRVRLLTLLRSAGTRKVTAGADTLIADLAGAFPDQKKWLQKLAPPGAVKLSELTDVLCYDGPVELLTMYLCLFLGGGMDKFSPAWLDQHRAPLIRRREQYTASEGLPPHCFVLCSLEQQTS